MKLIFSRQFLVTLITFVALNSLVIIASSSTYAKPLEVQLSTNTSEWEELSFADTKLGVINQLRSINEQTRHIRLKLNQNLPLREEELTEELQKANLGRELAQSLEVSFRLSKILNRPYIKDSAAYTQLLEALGLSMIDIGLQRLGYKRLLQYLQNSQSTPREYESMLFAYLDTAQKQNKTQQEIQQANVYSLEIIQKLWSKYLVLCERFKRSPNPAARYMIAKHFYFLKHYQKAQTELQLIARTKNYRLRALYIQGVIYLEQGNWEKAKSHFLSLEGFLQLNSKPKVNQKNTKSKMAEQTPTKLIYVRPRLKVTQVIKSSNPNQDQTLTQKTSAVKSQNPNELSPDLLALLEEVTQEKNYFTQSANESLGKPPLPEQRKMLKDLAIILQMTIARLTLLQGDYSNAWQRYREIPVGSKLYVESLLEAAYSMRMRRDYSHAAHLLQQAVDEYPSSEAAVELQLTQARMLVKSGQYELGKQLYKDLEQELKKQLIVIKNAQKSSLLFPPEVQAWLPNELALRSRQFSATLREQKLWLDQAQSDLEGLTQAYQNANYPALTLGQLKISKLQQILGQRLSQLPSLIRRWDKLNKDSSQKSKQSTFKQVNRGLIHNQNHRLNQSDSEQIKASVYQLKSRLLATQKEIKLRKIFYNKNLARLVKNERRAFNRALANYQSLKLEIMNLSKQAQQYALQKLENYLAQLTLGPSLSDFWEKERASERLESSQSKKFFTLGMLSRLNSQEMNAPKLQLLNLLDPVIKSLIVDPLPDVKESSTSPSFRSKRFKRKFRRP